MKTEHMFVPQFEDVLHDTSFVASVLRQRIMTIVDKKGASFCQTKNSEIVWENF